MNVDYTTDNTFIFSFVRMNPPTPGHLVLIKSMIDKAIEIGVEKAYVLTSSSLDGKNPLPCSNESIPKAKNKADAAIIQRLTQSNLMYKYSLLNNMISAYKQQLINSETNPELKNKIQKFQVIVLCSTGSPFGFINNIIKNDYTDKGIEKVNLFFIVGRDRADFLDTIVDNFKTQDYIKSVNGLILEREGMETLKNTGLGERSISDINPSEYSASFVRGLVKNGQKDNFAQVYSAYISPEDITKLYETISIGTQMKHPASKNENENPQSRYYDGGLLPIINAVGGKKRRKNTRKQRKTKRRKTKRHIRRHK